MQKFFALVGVVAIFTLTAGAARVVWWPASPREALIRSIIWVRATLPRNVNDRTTLVALGLHRDVFWSRFVFHMDADEINNKIKSEMRQAAVADVCMRLRSSLHTNLISTYYADYVDHKRKPIQTVVITKNDCR
jgi:hypothetical protein